jgi:hypothetical protein
VALHHEVLVPLHPLQQRLFLSFRRPAHHTVCRDHRHADGAVEPARLHRGATNPLLDHRLLEVSGRDADIPPEGQDLVLGHLVAQLALAGLELGRPVDDSVECGAVDPRG